MMQVYSIDRLLTVLRDEYGLEPRVEDAGDRHVLHLDGRSVEVGNTEKGNWYFGLLDSVDQHHDTPNGHYDLFASGVAQLLFDGSFTLQRYYDQSFKKRP
jgi:hypothetical protein